MIPPVKTPPLETRSQGEIRLHQTSDMFTCTVLHAAGHQSDLLTLKGSVTPNVSLHRLALTVTI